MNNKILKLVDECITAFGDDVVENSLATLMNERRLSNESDVLTIVANAGVHTIPKSYLRGEVYVASHGNWTAVDEKTLNREISEILLAAAKKLKQHPWRKVFLVPTGHPAVSMNIKVLVYRILRINTVDWVYLGGEYYCLEIDQRAIAIVAGDDSNGYG